MFKLPKDKFFVNLEKHHPRHSKGLFVVGPSGVGKTWFCKNQTNPHWIDGDELWIKAKAHPNYEWWNDSEEVIDEIDKQSDRVTEKAKSFGFWIIGASNFDLRPDAVVLPDWERHKAMIEHRFLNHYDGGATPDSLQSVLQHRKIIKEWVQEGVPCFESVEAATKAISDG